MSLYPFLDNVALMLIAAPVGAGVLTLMALPVQGWRAALRGWWYMTLLFLMIGVIATLPTLLTGGAPAIEAPAEPAFLQPVS